MKKLLLPIIFSLTVLSAFGQNQFPLNKNSHITIDGGYINMITPDVTNYWARGIMYTDVNSSTRMAGIGLLGLANEGKTIYLGFGESPWSSKTGTGLYVRSSGYVGIGTSSPQASLHLISTSPTQRLSTNKVEANLIIQANSTSKSVNSGASLGFVLPADTDGGNPWQQGRILTTPDNNYNYSASGRMYIQTRYSSDGAWHWRNNLVLNSSGYVGIGTEVPDAPLTVAGKIHAQEVKVTATAGGADFVFADDYALPKLAEVAAFVKENKHLPEIPSAAEMEANGLHLAEMNIKLLQKLEELTLYTIEQENQLAAQQEELAEKDRQFLDLLRRMESLEQKIQE